MIEITLIGEGIADSRTPAIHMSEAKILGIPYAYSLVDTLTDEHADKTLNDIVEGLENEGINGFNVTHPFKTKIMGVLDEISENARAVNAVNTVVLSNGVRRGDNTDIYGFYQMLAHGLGGEQPNKVVLFGAGGAGGAVIKALADYGTAQVFLYDSDQDKATELAQRLAFLPIDIDVVAPTALEKVAGVVDGFINATPMGMDTHPGSPIAPNLLAAHQFVADIVYFPLETQLLEDAENIGCRTISGSLMAVFQAARSFEIFTGEIPDEQRMLDSFSDLEPSE